MSCYIYSNDSYAPIPFPCNTVNGSANLITGQVSYSSYGYEPAQSATQGFLVLFCVGFAAQLLLSIYWKCWWTIPTLVAGTAIECVGWGGRLWSIYSWYWDINEGGYWYSQFGAFIMQICCLVIAPTFFSAANYLLFGRIIENAGPEYSSLHTQSSSTIFVIADIVCLVIQAAGGGIAGTAGDSQGANTGAYIMTGGVVVQLVVTVLFIALFCEWLWRRKHFSPAKKQYNPFARFYRKRNHTKRNNRNTVNNTENASFNEGVDSSGTAMEQLPSSRWQKDKSRTNSSTSPLNTLHGNDNAPVNVTAHRLSERQINLMVGLISAGTLLIVIRSFYRSVELSNGWEGPIATNEPLFLGLDGALMFIFVYLYAFIHPGLAFGRRLF
ncbi:uncharacterized protein I303_104475 [Kwoniella dejecticola CBS 10117]|uniref:Uncharacterized protein n=1 Tax=Kwoniella dejecticola CBS 10117 TaxID=1296121 RepID=A0A1A6A576_9TREE|nr:uncharacterized protein I303_04547 [Kwoniella dejecticola CBS 10117]OBR85214.1 hypothetical protein I303_04547 [Kwoniella dejecticola CBS 10117]